MQGRRIATLHPVINARMEPCQEASSPLNSESLAFVRGLPLAWKMQTSACRRCGVRLALTVWNGRISPLLDVARQVVLLEVEQGNILTRTERQLESEDPIYRAEELSRWKVDALICGAASQTMADLLVTYGIELISFVAGDTEVVIGAFLSGNLSDPELLMPGCQGRQRRGAWSPAECKARDTVVRDERRTAMPRGDGTGPDGRGSRTGRGRGGCPPQGSEDQSPAPDAPGPANGRGRGGRGRGGSVRVGRRSPCLISWVRFFFAVLRRFLFSISAGSL